MADTHPNQVEGDEPAFPLTAYPTFGDKAGAPVHMPGISRRDYFASAAMQGMIACINDDGRRPLDMRPQARSDFAAASYLMADAMITESRKPRAQAKDPVIP